MHGLTGCAGTVHLLGPVDVETPGGWHGGLPAQLRKVLAVLAVNREVSLSADQIVKRVWDGDPPESAIQMVRNQVRALRRLFEAFDGDVVERSHGGYRLSAGGVEVDAERFRSLVQEGRLRHAAGDAAGAVRLLTRGLDLWHGPEAMVDVRDVPDLQVEAVGLDELRFQAEEMVAEGYLVLGQPEEALPILRALTTLHQYREWPWLQLMAAQALIGRRVEASDETYRAAQHHLVGMTGLDAPLLAELHRALLLGVDGAELVAMIRRGHGDHPDH
ncbi:AfsR/SARP family transcriptional regulator [Plantactinospora mayteni]